MGPGLISGIYRPQDVRFHVKKMAEDRGAEFVLGKVVRVDPENRLLETDTEEMVEYDIVPLNNGSHVPAEDICEKAKKHFFGRTDQKASCSVKCHYGTSQCGRSPAADCW